MEVGQSSQALPDLRSSNSLIPPLSKCLLTSLCQTVYAKPFTHSSHLILSTYYVLGLAACFANEENGARGI